MSEKTKERLLELLADNATLDLSPEEHHEFDELAAMYPDLASDESFELAAAAFQMASLEEIEEMPSELQKRIALDAENHVGNAVETAEPASTIRQVEFENQKPSFIQWLGWAVAGAACLALVLNIWFIPFGITDTAGTQNPPPKPPTINEKRDTLLASSGLIRTEWTSPQKDLDVKGDIVWSNGKQEGYMRFRGLPVNDKSKETYQLWIFDETQDQATPVDGGVFDVDESGEVVIPIEAKLGVNTPKMFAVTVEKPGGVPVSKREKIVALAKV